MKVINLFGLFAGRMLATWGALGLIEMIVATLAGGWLYREA